MKLRLAAVLALVLAVSGCFPYHLTARPGISGVVVDDSSSLPVSGASITLNDPPADLTHTDVRGHFQIAPHQVWGIYIVSLEPPFNFPTVVTVSAFGYESVSLPLWSNVLGPRNVSLGEIHLKPTGRPLNSPLECPLAFR